MGKIIRDQNYRVEVEPDKPFISSKPREICNDIAESINRHVDNCLSVTVRHDAVAYCSFCERVWDEEDNGCPACCEKAQDEWAEMNGKKWDGDKWIEKKEEE